MFSIYFLHRPILSYDNEEWLSGSEQNLVNLSNSNYVCLCVVSCSSSKER